MGFDRKVASWQNRQRDKKSLEFDHKEETENDEQWSRLV